MNIAETSSHHLDTIGNNCPEHSPTDCPSGSHAIWEKRGDLKEKTLEVMDAMLAYMGEDGKAIPSRHPHKQDAKRWASRYLQTSFCHHTILHQGNKAMVMSCRHRWCGVCNRDRMRKAVRAYGEQLKELPDPYMVTLTIKNCKGKKLNETLTKMQETWRSIYKVVRNECGMVYGFKKLEITYNQTTDEYHPHYHLMVSGLDQAMRIQSLWMAKLGKQLANQGGQAVHTIMNPDKAMLEVLKYCYKTYQEGEVIPPQALHTIHLALYRRRTHEPLGIKKAPEVQLELPATLVMDTDTETPTEIPVIYIWRRGAGTWVNGNGEPWVIRNTTTKRQKNGKDTG